MKKIFPGLVLLLMSSLAFCQKRAVINEDTKDFTLLATLADQYTIYGYAGPSLRSKPLILFSGFPQQVQESSCPCPLGTYYETVGLKKGDRIMYESTERNFVKLNYITGNNKVTPFYVRRGSVKFN